MKAVRTRSERSARKRGYYRANPEQRARSIAQAKAHLAAKREHVARLKEESPCMDCGLRWPAFVMDYDHVRGVKRASVGQLLTAGYALRVVLEEIAKCDLVCANCHRIRTMDARGGYGERAKASSSRSEEAGGEPGEAQAP
jgi:hypothetical protein